MAPGGRCPYGHRDDRARDGVGGPEIGIELAKRLGWRYVDRDMLSEAAHRYGVGEDKLTELDEKKPSLFERFDVETRQYITVLQSALLDAAEQDNVVINSRGGQMLLRGISHVLRGLRDRAVRAQGQAGDEEDGGPGAGGRGRPHHDGDGAPERPGEEWTDPLSLRRGLGDPALYDVVLNTEKLTVEAGVEAIAGLVRGLAATPESRQQVRDRALSSRVRSALAAHPDTRKYRPERGGRPRCDPSRGTAALERATEVARTVPGVVDVKSQLLEVPPIPPFVA